MSSLSNLKAASRKLHFWLWVVIWILGTVRYFFTFENMGYANSCPLYWYGGAIFILVGLAIFLTYVYGQPLTKGPGMVLDGLTFSFCAVNVVFRLIAYLSKDSGGWCFSRYSSSFPIGLIFTCGIIACAIIDFIAYFGKMKSQHLDTSD